jgi:hypothetical protein
VITLETGKLYQVKHWEKGWIIAEYVKEIAAHSYRYSNLNMMTCSVGPEKTRNVPLSHQWKKIGWGSTFTVEAKGMEVRPVTQETLDTITRLKAEILQLEAEQVAKRKELRELCN